MTIRKLKFRTWVKNEMFNMPLDNNYGISRFFGFIPDDVEIMQFTGLLDIRGIDIYEGDIIRSDKNCMRAAGYEKGEVIFYDGCFRVKDVALSIIVQAFHPIIVGNIHKNPELLKGCD